LKIIAPHSNTSLAPISNILFVLRPWTLRQRNGVSWGAIRDFILHYRANPRSAEYMLELASEFKNNHASGATAELLVDDSLLADISDKHRTWFNRIFTHFTFDELSNKNYDTVALLYEDPIGLGWENIEGTLKKLKSAQTIVINGRRREFIWDEDAQRTLATRRFFAKAGWIESLLVPWLWISASLFYLSDLVRGKTREEG
jgi:hypothetical protein